MRIEVEEEIVPQDYNRGNQAVEEVVFLRGVREIGLNAFRDCPNLRRVTIPATVHRIGNCAFMMCKNLTEVEIEEGLVEIGNSAFWRCENLMALELPPTLKSIGREAFDRCLALTDVRCENDAIIPDNAFQGTPFKAARDCRRAEEEREAARLRRPPLEVYPNVQNEVDVPPEVPNGTLFVCVEETWGRGMRNERGERVSLEDCARGFWLNANLNAARADNCGWLMARMNRVICGVWKIDMASGWMFPCPTLMDARWGDVRANDPAYSGCELLQDDEEVLRVRQACIGENVHLGLAPNSLRGVFRNI